MRKRRSWIWLWAILVGGAWSLIWVYAAPPEASGFRSLVFYHFILAATAFGALFDKLDKIEGQLIELNERLGPSSEQP